jgi:hypothetical protein
MLLDTICHVLDGQDGATGLGANGSDGDAVVAGFFGRFMSGSFRRFDRQTGVTDAAPVLEHAGE